ncbi:hypothetical protein ACH5RR_037103 [Cinchona calisaya]|uniref:WLM domain-containing protein n=1 Tax=Cinchona calisaya TaxID=153742 RepID=A0ABD2Y9K3_9GENT
MMQTPEKQLSVTWRGKKFLLDMKQGANLKELGDKLQQLTNVRVDTLRLIIPTNKGSKMLYPFSDEHSYLPLEAASILEGKPIRMMGVPENEVEEVLQSAKTDLRIAGFDEEEKRMRQRILYGRNSFVQLPQGTYIFSEFRTLSIPGIELRPPATEALKLMRRLAADPGIVAIMNKHRWRVGIMTEMAPVGYVGVSPKCLLGFNKNHGEEISLRLRTDDLNGFRKYESIKKTLLHELAHMVYSEHDANFYALDKQLNQEAAALDWTKSKGHTLNGVSPALLAEEEFDNRVSLSRKLGGQDSVFSNARASSVAAAYHRFANTSNNVFRAANTLEEPDPDDSVYTVCQESDSLHAGGKTEVGHADVDSSMKFVDGHKDHNNKFEPDPDDSEGRGAMESESYLVSCESRIIIEPDPDDSEVSKIDVNKESALENLKVPLNEVGPNLFGAVKSTRNLDQPTVILVEPDPDDSQMGDDDNKMMVIAEGISIGETDEPDPDDPELKRIQDPVTAVYDRLQKAMEILRSEVNPLDAGAVVQTLCKIVRNVIEHPNEVKFRKIRKANAVIQRNILHYGAASEILHLVGFSEDVVFDEKGEAETYLVLKRNDPGLMWLVKSSLESFHT